MTKLIAAVLFVLGIIIPLRAPGNERSRECREGTGDLGIGQYHCDGGSCTVSEVLRGGRVAHRFSVEPRVTDIDPKGASLHKLMENDVLVSIDGALVTTFEGGYKLANAKIGEAVRMRIRRGGRELEVQVIPAKGCNRPGLTVRN